MAKVDYNAAANQALERVNADTTTDAYLNGHAAAHILQAWAWCRLADAAATLADAVKQEVGKRQ